MTPMDLVEIIQDEGYRAKLLPEDNNTVGIETKIGYATLIILSLEADRVVRSACFSASFADQATLKSMNDWNVKNRFVSAYINENGNPRFQMDAILIDATKQNFAVYLSTWDYFMREVGLALS